LLLTSNPGVAQFIHDQAIAPVALHIRIAAAQYFVVAVPAWATISQRTTMSRIWQTKFGSRRVRRDPPTLAEAIAAARGLTEDVTQQVEIAAALMDLPPDEVRPEVLAAATRAAGPAATAARKGVTEIAYVGRSGAPRTVVVERKPSRRLVRKTIDR
jgi:hypothetical protein